MDKKVAFNVKIKSFTWKNYVLIICKKGFQLMKESPNSKISTYSLKNAVVLDQSEKSDPKISIISPLYKFLIKINRPEDKNLILSKIEEIIKENSAKTAFSEEYLKHLKEYANHEDKSPIESVLFKLNSYKLLIGEMDIQLLKFKSMIKEKLNSSLTGEFWLFIMI